uniref:Uncharacterized protein n=1 Tax=Romanomermis culicivorax TaxID=13658 RepID=A0A915JJ60_ROMCU
MDTQLCLSESTKLTQLILIALSCTVILFGIFLLPCLWYYEEKTTSKMKKYAKNLDDGQRQDNAQVNFILVYLAYMESIGLFKKPSAATVPIKKRCSRSDFVQFYKQIDQKLLNKEWEEIVDAFDMKNIKNSEASPSRPTFIDILPSENDRDRAATEKSRSVKAALSIE